MDLENNLYNFTDILNDDEEVIENSQPMSLNTISPESQNVNFSKNRVRPEKHAGQYGEFRSVEEIDSKYRNVFTYPYFNLVQSRVIEDALYSDKSLVVCAPTGSGKTVVFEMTIVKLLMDLEDQGYTDDFKIIYMAPVKAICTERLTEWYSKFTELGILCIEVTGDTDVEFSQLKPYKIIITTPEKWDILTRRWTDHRNLVEVIKLFLIDEVHLLNDEARGPVLEAVVSRMRTIEASCITSYRNEMLKSKVENHENFKEVETSPRIRFVAVSATVSNPEDVATWLGNCDKPAACHKFGDECRPVKINKVVEGYPCAAGTSIFKFDIILNYKLWSIIQKYYYGKPTLIFCNTRKGVMMTAETLSREITITFNPEQQAKLTALTASIKNKKLQALVRSGVGYHHAGMLFEERIVIEQAFRNRDLPILITTTTLAMGVNLPAHLVIIKNTQYYVNGAYQEYPISTVLQMIGRAGRPQFDTEATAVIMTRSQDKFRYQSLVGGSEPLQSYLHRRLAENLNSEAALHTVTDLAQCVDWLRSTFLFVRAGRDPRRYLNLPSNATPQHISKKIEDLCVKAMNGLASSGLITMDDACCIESTEAGRLMSIFYIDFETMKHIMKIEGTESLERLLWILCESHELAEMHLRVDERRCLNTLNRNCTSSTIRFPMKGKISTRQMKLNCIIQAILGSLPIPDPALGQEAIKIMRIADRVCKCMVSYITRPELITRQSPYYSAILNGIILAKCIVAQLWENSPYVCRQLRGIGPAFSNSLVTAGKKTFALLEESHPRDLERIMNKGPPAGNILRKQISLLPKYQLSLTPLNHKSVSVKLTLLNKAFLAENMDNLTAGDNHKTYIIIGNTENTLILFTFFRDKDLINVYDGCLTYLVDRKNDFEQKITVNCISTTFVGIDVTAEYTFKEADHIGNKTVSNDNFLINTSPKAKVSKKQSVITDTFKEKKRKTNDFRVECMEKRKRESAIISEYNSLKKSLRHNYEELKEQLQKSEEMSKNILNEINNKSYNKDKNDIYLDKIVPTKLVKNSDKDDLPEVYFHDSITNNSNIIDNDIAIVDNEFPEIDLPDHELIKNILNKVENEIMLLNDPSMKLTHDKKLQYLQVKNTQKCREITSDATRKITLKLNNRSKQDNFTFLELMDKNENMSDEEKSNYGEENGFSKTIKCNLDKFLENTKEQNNIKKQDFVNLLSNDISRDVLIPNEIYIAKPKYKELNAPSDNLLLNNNKVDEAIICANKNLNSSENKHENNYILENGDYISYIEKDPISNNENMISSVFETDTSSNLLQNESFFAKNNEKSSYNKDEITKLNNYSKSTITDICNILDDENIANLYNNAKVSLLQNTPNTKIPMQIACVDNINDFTIVNKVTRNISANKSFCNNVSVSDVFNTSTDKNRTQNISNLHTAISDIFNNENNKFNLEQVSECNNELISVNNYEYFEKYTNNERQLVNTLDIDSKDAVDNNSNKLFTNDLLIYKNKNNYNNNTEKDNSRQTKIIKVNKVETSITSNFSTYEVNYSKNMKQSKCQLELINKCTLDLDVTDIINDENMKDMVVFNPNNDKAELSRQKPCISNEILPLDFDQNILRNSNNVSNLNNKINNLLKPNFIVQENSYNKPANIKHSVTNESNIQEKEQNTLMHSIKQSNEIKATMKDEISGFSKSDLNSNSKCVEFSNPIIKTSNVHLKNIKHSIPNELNFIIQGVNSNKTAETTNNSNLYVREKGRSTPIMNTVKANLEGELFQFSNHNLKFDPKCVEINQKVIIKNKPKEQINVNTVNPAEIIPHLENNDSNSAKIIESSKKNNIEDHKGKPMLSVENILSKYSNVLKKNDIIAPIENSAFNQNSDPDIKKNKTIPQKLFHIKDINRINIDIPESLIPNIPSHSSVEEVENFIENKQNDYDELKLKEIMETSTIEVDTEIPENKFKVDSLDPKKLLESYQDNNEFIEILPPPEEFSDNIPNTEEIVNENDLNVMEFENSLINDINNREYFDDPMDESYVKEKKLFEDVSGPSVASVNMSISHEIETWTLTPDNEINHIRENPIKSFTVMRTKPIYSSSINYNRAEKMTTFKFKNKEKFRFHK